MFAESGKGSSVLVVGGGVAGIQAAMDLADSGHHVFLVERTGGIGGGMAQLDKIFPTDDCSMCLIGPRIAESGRHPNIELFTLSEIQKVLGAAGDFTVFVREHPRYVDMTKCVACGACSERCPQLVSNEFDMGAGRRKAIYIKYPQAVPLKYQIDPDACRNLLQPGSCSICSDICLAGAIDFEARERIHKLSVGAIILAPGFEPFNPAAAEVWGYGKLANVITSVQLERYLSATGPTEGRLIRPSDGKSITKIAFLQCVGSRDENRCDNGYCSSVCCMAAIKEAIAVRRYDLSLTASIYFMDMRTMGKNFEEYMELAKGEHGVRFVRCRVHGVEPFAHNGDLRLHYINEEGRQVEEMFDVVVLSVGLVTPSHVKELAEITGVQLSASSFASTSDFAPVTTSKEGVFACGSFAEPKGIALSVVEGAAAAAEAAKVLETGEKVSIQRRRFPVERNVAGESPAVAVYICHCGTNIAGVVDVDVLAGYTGKLPGVVHVEKNLFLCSEKGQEEMIHSIREQKINRVVIAACSPLTHEPLFREALQAGGINEHLLEIANIRNQNSWVHDDSGIATQKAKDLVRMAVAKVRLSVPIRSMKVSIHQGALVVGGGISGMTAALNLADQGYHVDLVEKSERLGGNALNLKHTRSGVHVPMQVAKLVDRVQTHEKISLHLSTVVTGASGFVGTFRTKLKSFARKSKTIEHGVAVIATGGNIYRPSEYGYKRIRCVVTSIEFERLYELKEKHVKRAKSFVFIQCVGSREKNRMYCSKVCCTHSVQSAIELKREDPSRSIYILYRDMRTYGEREFLFRKAREMGVVFINYELHGKPKVQEVDNRILVDVWDHVLHRPLRIKADMVILAAAIVANEGGAELAQVYQIPLDSNGFFQEAHADLRPVDFHTEGLFVAGMAHFPKPVDECVSQALAAAGRAATLLSRRVVELDGLKAIVNEARCDGCALCIDVCPYHAIELAERPKEKGEEPAKIVVINQAQCKGCGVCQGTCPLDAVDVAGFSMEQLRAQIRAALSDELSDE